MHLVGEILVCTRGECGAEFVVKTKPGIEKQDVRCTCGSELKKLYRSPVLTVYGKTPPSGVSLWPPKESGK
jgi:hypothetical protein